MMLFGQDMMKSEHDIKEAFFIADLTRNMTRNMTYLNNELSFSLGRSRRSLKSGTNRDIAIRRGAVVPAAMDSICLPFHEL